MGDLLISEVSEESGGSIWRSIKDLQQKIANCGASDSLITSDIPISVWTLEVEEQCYQMGFSVHTGEASYAFQVLTR